MATSLLGERCDRRQHREPTRRPRGSQRGSAGRADDRTRARRARGWSLATAEVPIGRSQSGRSPVPSRLRGTADRRATIRRCCTSPVGDAAARPCSRPCSPASAPCRSARPSNSGRARPSPATARVASHSTAARSGVTLWPRSTSRGRTSSSRCARSAAALSACATWRICWAIVRWSGSADVARYGAVMRTVYRSVARATGAATFVDSSKLPIELAAIAPSCSRLRVIHLVRDPRAVAASWKRDVRWDMPDGSTLRMPTHAAWASAARWDLYHGLTSLVVRGRRLPTLRVSYESLVRLETRAMAEVAAFIDDPRLPDRARQAAAQAGLAVPVQHAIAGNPGRRSGESLVLREDDSWTSELSGGERLAVSAIGLPYTALRRPRLAAGRARAKARTRDRGPRPLDPRGRTTDCDRTNTTAVGTAPPPRVPSRAGSSDSRGPAARERRSDATHTGVDVALRPRRAAPVVG